MPTQRAVEIIPNAEWLGELSVADQLLIEGLDPRTRAAVERYVRSTVWDELLRDDGCDDEPYDDDWNDEDDWRQANNTPAPAPLTEPSFGDQNGPLHAPGIAP